MSDCGRYGLSIIAFVGSVFSPYYAWSGRRDPDDHVAMNVALYRPGDKRWAMTERGRRALARDASSFTVGPSAMRWHGDRLTTDFDEIAVPRPPAEWGAKRLKGTATLYPEAVTGQVFDIDTAGAHRWWPIAPAGRIEVAMADGTHWAGHGYLDCNWGLEPLETGFKRWDWARGPLPDGRTLILYDTETCNGGAVNLALAIERDGRSTPIETPPRRPLKRGFWGVERTVRCDSGHQPVVTRTLEDGPFYLRSLVETHIGGQALTLFHESVSGERFSQPVVKAMLPFRMPRRARV